MRQQKTAKNHLFLYEKKVSEKGGNQVSLRVSCLKNESVQTWGKTAWNRHMSRIMSHIRAYAL